MFTLWFSTPSYSSSYLSLSLFFLSHTYPFHLHVFAASCLLSTSPSLFISFSSPFPLSLTRLGLLPIVLSYIPHFFPTLLLYTYCSFLVCSITGHCPHQPASVCFSLSLPASLPILLVLSVSHAIAHDRCPISPTDSFAEILEKAVTPTASVFPPSISPRLV